MAQSFHAAANLSSMKTATIAFLANGVGSPYPCENIALFSRLINEGIALAEMAFATQPLAKLLSDPQCHHRFAVKRGFDYRSGL